MNIARPVTLILVVALIVALIVALVALTVFPLEPAPVGGPEGGVGGG